MTTKTIICSFYIWGVITDIHIRNGTLCSSIIRCVMLGSLDQTIGVVKASHTTDTLPCNRSLLLTVTMAFCYCFSHDRDFFLSVFAFLLLHRPPSSMIRTAGGWGQMENHGNWKHSSRRQIRENIVCGICGNKKRNNWIRKETNLTGFFVVAWGGCEYVLLYRSDSLPETT